MNFQVPQFIEVEDKIFGPLTFKQFVYVAGGVAAIFLLKSFLPLYLAIIPMAIIGVFAGALAFYKVNNRPFILVSEAAFRYLLGNRLYLWRKEHHPNRLPEKAAKASGGAAVSIPKLSRSRLKDLSWSLDVKETVE